MANKQLKVTPTRVTPATWKPRFPERRKNAKRPLWVPQAVRRDGTPIWRGTGKFAVVTDKDGPHEGDLWISLRQARVFHRVYSRTRQTWRILGHPVIYTR